MMKNSTKPFIAIFLLLVLTQNLLGFDGQEGLASWYGEQFNGRLTANGETFDMSLLTAAHKTLPFGTVVRVTNLKNNKSIEVRINDRGPFVAGRIIDLSKAAFEKIESLTSGTAQVRLKVVSVPNKPVIYKQPSPHPTPTPNVITQVPPTQPSPSPIPISPPSPTPSPTSGSAILDIKSQITVSNSVYTIQVGAFSKMDNALRCKETIYSILGPVLVEIETAGSVFRVKVVKINANDLEKTKDALSSGGYSNVIVREEIK